MTSLLPEIMTAADARKELASITERFRNEGAEAKPVFFGSHRKPEAVLLSIQRYEEMMSKIEDIYLAELIRERLKQPVNEVSFEEVLKQLGITREELRSTRVYVE